jgi:hypothetical protein
MRDFVFESRTKTFTYALMAIGVLCLGLTWFSNDPLHMQFWGNWLHNSVFFTGISVVAMFFMCAQIVAFAGWNAMVRRLWEAQSQFVIVGLVLFIPLIIGLFGNWHHLYHWNVEGISDPNSPNFDKIIAGKSAFVNKFFYTFATIIVLGSYYAIARKVRQHSIEQDSVGTGEFIQYRRIRTLAAIFLPVFGFTSIVLTWQWMMSLDAHWYSTMYGWYSWASLFLAMISFTILLTIWLKSKGYLEQITGDHLHDLGKYMFGLTVFWTYLWFDQYMLIWYANIGEETIYFKERWYQYPLLHAGNLVINFVLPFLILMRNDNKRKFGTLVFIGILVFLGHWWDYYQMIKPSTRLAVIEHQLHENHGATSSHEAGNIHASEVSKGAEVLSETAVVSKGVEMVKEGGEKVSEITHQGAEKAKEIAPKMSEKVSEIAEKAISETKEMTHEAIETAKSSTEPEVAEHEVGHESGEITELHGKKPFVLGWNFPNFLDFGTMLGFLGLFVFVVLSNLEKAALKPKNDPWMEEAENHHVV